MIRFVKSHLKKTILSCYKNTKGWLRFWNTFFIYRNISPLSKRPLIKNLEPYVGDYTGETPIEPIYFYQDTWAFEKILERMPKYHIDVGSHHKFVAFLSKVLPVTMVDIRPLSLSIESLKFKKGSILNLPFNNKSVPSLSSLCVLEHIGLGRYGDPLDPFGSEKALNELKRVIMPNGDLYISLPINDENITYFNAHRAFEEDYILNLLDDFTILERKYIYGKNSVKKKKKGFGIGCYYLKKHEEE